MKKYLSLILAVCMLFSLANVSFAQETVEEQIAVEQDEERVAFEKNKKAEDGEAIYLAQKKMDETIRNKWSSEDDSVSLMATYGVSGTIYLPDGVKANNGDEVLVYLYPAAEISDNCIIEDYGNTAYSTKVSLKKNATSISYTLNAASGDYILAAKYFTGRSEISSEWYYHTTDGVTKNPYLASVITVKSKKVTSKNIELPAAETQVEGTIDLSDCVPTEAGYIYVYAEMEHDSVYLDQYVAVPYSKGDKSVDFEIGLMEGRYYFSFSSGLFNYGYYSNGTLSNSWDKRTIFDVGSDGAELEIKAPKTEATTSSNQLAVTLTLNSAVSEEKEYFFELIDENYKHYGTGWLYIEEGEKTGTRNITISSSAPDEGLYLAFRDVTGCYGVSYLEEGAVNGLYYSEDNGFVGSILLATDIAGESKVTVDEPTTLTIKGDIVFSGVTPMHKTMIYVGADFGDETFCTFVNAVDGEYEITVPKRLAKETFTLFKAEESYGIAENIENFDEAYTLKSTGTTTAGDIDMGEYLNITGTIYLPAAAPENGAVVTMGYEYDVYNGQYWDYVFYSEVATYIIEPGKTSVDYTLSVPAEIEELWVNANLQMYDYTNISSYASNWINLMEENECDLFFTETVTLSGTISLPDGVTYDEDVEIYIGVAQIGDYGGCSIIIPAGKTKADYSLSIAKDDTIRYVSIETYNAEDLLSKVYYNGAVFVSEYTQLNLYVSGDIQISGTLIQSETLTVSVTVPEGEFEGKLYLSAAAISTYGNGYSTSTKAVTEAGTYLLNIPIPQDEYAEYHIQVEVWANNEYDGNVLLGDYVYAEAGWVTQSDDYVYFSLGDTIPAITLPTKSTVTIEVAMSDEIYAQDGLSVCAYLVDANGNRLASNYYYVDDIKDCDGFKLEYPSDLTGNVAILYEIDGWGNTNIDNSEFYYSTTGPVKTIDEASFISIKEGMEITINVERLKGMFGKIVINGNYEYVTPLEELYFILSSTSGTTSSYGLTATIDENLNFAASYQSYIPEGDYYVSYSTSGNYIFGTNILQKDNEQVLNADGTPVIVTVGEDATGIEVELEAGMTVKGTVSLPEDAVLNEKVGVEIVFEGMESFSTYIYDIDNENRSADYMIGVDPEYAGDYIVRVNVYEQDSSTGGFTNLMMEREYYRVSDTECTTVYKEAEEVEVNERTSDVDITLMTGVGVDVTVNLPSSVSEYCRVLVALQKADYYPEAEKEVYFAAYSNQQKTMKTSVILPKDCLGEEYYLTYYVYQEIPELIYRETLFVSTDGTISYTEETVTPFTITEKSQEVTINIAKADDLPVIWETDHPYQTGQVYTYTYTHPEDADYLEVYFSDSSSINYNHSLIFYDENGNQLSRYYGGTVVNVPGNSFTLELDATSYSYYSNYGVKIIDIVGKDYIAQSKHSYTKEDLPIVYEYTHPEDADELDIYFSSNTYIADGTRMDIFNGDGEVEYQLYGTMYGDFVTVPGNYFQIVIQKIYDYVEEGAFGFAIERIEPVYYHTVTFKDYDGTVLQEKRVRHGDYAWYDGDEDYLIRESNDEDYVYVFDGWDNDSALENVTEDVTVTATYAYIRAYDIVFKNIDGTILDQQKVPHGYYIVYDGVTPQYPYESNVTYTFKGWDKSVEVIAKSDMVFTAEYNKVYIQSEHNYKPDSDERYEYTAPGATSLVLTFSDNTYVENNWDYIYIYAVVDGEDRHVGTYTGYVLQGAKVTVPSDTVAIRLTSDSGIQYYGFAVTDIEAVYDYTNLDITTEVYVTKYNTGCEVTVDATLGMIIGGKIIIGIYDDDGNLIEAKSGNAINGYANVTFNTTQTPAYVKTMLWSSEDGLEPIAEAVVTESDAFEVTQGNVEAGGTVAGGTAAGEAISN